MSIETEGTSDLLTAAHEYAKMGWRVIPLHRVNEARDFCSCRAGGRCTSKGKHPINSDWQNQPALNGPDIQETWDVAKPPNLGLAVGARSGFWVLDIDPEHGGFETMQALTAEHGRLPETFVVRTGSGGFHYYFAMPEGIDLRNTQGRVGPGIDTRATGGQVVAAPSRSDKGDYVVFTSAPLTQAPAWLLEVVRKEEIDPASIVTAADLPKPEDMEPAEWDRLNAYAQKAIKGNLDRLDAMKAAAVQPGRAPETYRGEPWNATTFQVAAALIEIANSPWCSYGMGQARSDVFNHAPRDDEFDDYVVNKTFESAREKVGEKARPVPEDRRAEPDPLFTSPDVRSGPTRTDGEPTGPVSGGSGHSPDDFFDKKDLQVATLAHAILAEGPLAYGRDEAFWSFDHGVWVSEPDVVRNRCVDLLGERYRNGHADNVSSVVKRYAMKLEASPVERFLNFENGMLDWRTGEMLGHDPNLKSTIQFPLDYDPGAVCPTFDRFLAEVMHDDYVDLAWEMIGYLMLSGNPLQVAFLFYGSGGNGKGTLMRVIEDLLGKHNVASESLDDLNGNRFSAVNLFGRIANLAGDIDGTYQEHTANFKKLVGEDAYAGERKFGQRFTFQNWAVPVFSANKIPGSADVTEGYLRRWVVLHFHKRIQNMIPGLSDLLAEELPGIAAKAVRALRVLMERKRFAPHGEAVKGKEEFALAIDQVRQWLASGDALMAPAQSSPLHALYSSYSIWAGRSGQGRLRESEFSLRLKAIGYEPENIAGIAHHKGLSVHTPAGHPVSAGFF